MLDNNAYNTWADENNGCKSKENGYRGEIDTFAPEVDTIVRVLFDDDQHHRIYSPSIVIHVDIEHVMKTESPLGKHGCNTAIRERYSCSDQYQQLVLVAAPKTRDY